ncbi:outer membrane protein [Devosia sp.]|uniref:outer membrane protein n=1 Tax=Devosia sp. TaxID=1871048 RepID=UPI00326568DE
MHKIIATALLASASIAIAAPAYAQANGTWVDPSASAGNSSQALMYGSSAAYDWTGFYAGGSLGYGAGTLSTNAIGNPQNDLRGFAGGGELGFNVNLGGLVLGAEADAQLANVNYSVTTGGVVTSSFNVDYYASARARVGYAYNQFMPYVTAGVVGGQGTSKYTTFGGVFSQSNFHTGWTAGGGVEFAVADNVTIKAEYLYTDLGTKTYQAGIGLPVDATFRFGTFRVGANFQF